MKYFLLIFLLFLPSCEIIDPPIEVEKTSGSLEYKSLIGTVWYCDKNLAASFDGLTRRSNTIEKWWFYAESIVVIATHYDINTLEAQDQFKYVATLSDVDRIFWGDDNAYWRTTTSWWKQYARAYNSCTWTDMFSFQTGPWNIMVNDVGKVDTIGFGSYEGKKYYWLTKTSKRIVYPANWYPGVVCGYVQ